tara:strand:+ start:378 stop:1793 length:1416 start_codon:yes stop_codon:yes gene_type:complete
MTKQYDDRQVFTNGKVFVEGELKNSKVIVEDGIVIDIVDSSFDTEGFTTIDLQGRYLLPGAIDVHVHCRAPAAPERGDFATETRAAAAGGITTMLEMPISKPCVNSVAVFENRKKLGQDNAYVDFGLYCGPVDCDEDTIHNMVNAGAIAFKAFMVDAPPGREDEFDGIAAADKAQLLMAFQNTTQYNIPFVIHCEDDQLLNHYIGLALEQDLSDPMIHPSSRPDIVEAIAISDAVMLADHVNRPIHIAHVSSAKGLDVIRRAIQSGVAVTGEVCLHYLEFTAEILSQAGPYAKVNPPMRFLDDQKALWQGVTDNILSILTTDHAPFTADEKEAAWEDLVNSPPGLPSLEMLYPRALHHALNGRWDLDKAVDLVCVSPAKLFNLWPKKGVIRIGSDADFVIFDPNEEYVVDSSKWFTKAKDCDRVYSGLNMNGNILQTYVRGELIYGNGEIVGERGFGEFVRPLQSIDHSKR